MNAHSPSLFGRPVPRTGLALLLVLTAWAFLPLDRLSTWDSQKTLVLVIGAALLSLVALRRRAPARDGDPLVLVPLVLTATAVLVTVLAGPRGSLEGPFLALAACCAARLAAGDTDGRAGTLALARGAAVAALGAGAYALLQRAGLDPTPWGARREVVATFGNTSYAASFQAAALPLALFLTLRPGRDRLLGGSAALLAATHLVLATSRIDLVAAGAAVAVGAVLLLRGRGRRRGAACLLGAGVVAALVFAALFVATATGHGPAFLGRSDTLAVRLHIWRSFAALVPSVPLWLPQGGTFVDLFPAVRAPQEFLLSYGRTVDTPHNDLFGLAVTLGVTGAAVALVAFVALVRRLWTGTADAPERAALTGTLVALFVSALASSPLTHGATALLLALAWGTAIALRPARATAPHGETRAAHGTALAALVVVFFPALGILRSDTFLASGRVALARGEPAKALELLDMAAAADSRAFEPRAELGGILLSAHEAQAAVKALRSALEIRPHDPEARANLARALLVGGAPDEARRVLDTALRDCPWHPELQITAGHIALADGRGDDAVRAFEAAAPYFGHVRFGHEPRILALVAEARLLATPGGPAHETALTALKALLVAGDIAQVKRSVPAMLGRDPTLLPALVAMARRITAEAPESAATLVMSAASLPVAQEDTGFLEEGGQILIRAGHRDQGTVFIGHALGVRARAALARGENEAALRLARKAAQRDPDPRHWLVTARALARLGQNDGAIEAVGTAVATGPVDAALVRADPDLGPLARDERLDMILKRAAERSGDVP